MPHNVVFVEPDRLSFIGEESMKLAASPDGVAKHYVPEDKGVIALSPVLQSGNSYMIYFRSPRKPNLSLPLHLPGALAGDAG